MAPTPKPKKRVQPATEAHVAKVAARKEQEKANDPPASALEAVKACKPLKFRVLVDKELRGKPDRYDPGPMTVVLSQHYFAGMLPKKFSARYGKLKTFLAFEAQGFGMPAGYTHIVNGRVKYVIINPALGYPEATQQLDEAVVHECGVHVVTVIDGIFDGHGEHFLEVAQVVSEKTGVAIAVELTEAEDEFLRSLVAQLPDEPDWTHADWMKHFQKIRKSPKYRRETAGRRSKSFLTKAKEWVFRRCGISLAPVGSSALTSSSSAVSDGQEEQPAQREKKLVKHRRRSTSSDDPSYHPSSDSDVGDSSEDVKRSTKKRPTRHAAKPVKPAQPRRSRAPSAESSHRPSPAAKGTKSRNGSKGRTVERSKQRAEKFAHRRPLSTSSDESSYHPSTHSDDSD